MNLHVFYMMNGQIIFADLKGENEDTCDYIVSGAAMVMIGQGNQIQMSTAFPFSSIELPVELSWRLVTAKTSLDWNKQLGMQYDNFWEQIRAKAAGIEIVPAGAGPPIGPGLGAQQKRPGPMKIIK